MLQGLLVGYNCALHETEAHPGDTLYQYYLVKDERNGVRGFLCVLLERAGILQGGGSLGPREEHNMLAFFWLDAIEGNEAALHEEREKLRRRKARAERMYAEAVASEQHAQQMERAQADEMQRRGRETQKEFRRQQLQLQVKGVQRRMLTQIQTRGAASIYSLNQAFASMDLDKSYTLDRKELMEGMLKQGLELHVDEVDHLINFYDNDGAGDINYAELVEALKHELNERRYNLVRKAFAQLDSAGKGSVSLDAIAQVYRPREHPDVKARRRTEADVLREFLVGFERQQAATEVSFDQFEAFFATHSRAIDDDDYFATMMRFAWGVVE